MLKKLAVKMYENWWPRTFIFLCIFLFALALLFATTPKIVAEIAFFFFGALLLLIAVKAIIDQEKEAKELANMTPEKIKEKWQEYVNLVNEMAKEEKFNLNQVSKDWYLTFDDVMNMQCRIITDRKFNDFDIASCLFYSLNIGSHFSSSTIRFAFSCLPEIISSPKEYTRDVGLAGKISLEVANFLPRVDQENLKKNLTSHYNISTIKSYLSNAITDEENFLQDFAHFLYKIYSSM